MSGELTDMTKSCNALFYNNLRHMPGRGMKVAGIKADYSAAKRLNGDSMNRLANMQIVQSLAIGCDFLAEFVLGLVSISR